MLSEVSLRSGLFSTRFSRRLIRRNRFTMLAIGGVSSALTLMLALALISGQSVEAGQDAKRKPAVNAESVFQTVNLVSAAESIPQGSRIRKESLRIIAWPSDRVPPDSVRRIEDLDGLYARASLAIDQPIARANLSAQPLSTTIGDLLPAGHRAVTIEVDATAGVEGWATPGAHVDVFLTYLDAGDGINKTRVAVEDAVVLSYDGSLDTTNSNENQNQRLLRTSKTSTVTLAVSFEDSLKIQTARAMGRISLVLRNANDVKSMGRGVFAADEWERKADRYQRGQYASRGFARYQDSSGQKREYVLDDKARWWESKSRQ